MMALQSPVGLQPPRGVPPTAMGLQPIPHGLQPIPQPIPQPTQVAKAVPPGSLLKRSPPNILEKREVVFSQQVPVEPRNTGVIIVHQYMGEPGTPGQEIVRYDDFVRNQRWQHLGPLLPTAEELAAQMQVQQAVPEKRGAGYKSTPSVWDVAPKDGKAAKVSRVNPFSDKARLNATGEYVARVLRSEFMDEKGLQNFFSSPEAVSYDETPSV
mmetsp:Transcript_18725/g.23012  ORF Transcript_18725/g.23012 Transcript_18725/m.23012 type:complete len:212 (-) Transcript_18725:72-707(-)